MESLFFYALGFMSPALCLIGWPSFNEVLDGSSFSLDHTMDVLSAGAPSRSCMP